MLGRQMHLGILTARRGWVEPRHVLNTRPLARRPRRDRRETRVALIADAMTRRALLAALAVALAAFALYRATLLPGVDFGDTGSFQTMVGSPLITPRDGYPLYFAIGRSFSG